MVGDLSTAERNAAGRAPRGLVVIVGGAIAVLVTVLAVRGAAGDTEDGAWDAACDVGLAPCTTPLVGGGRVTLALEPRPLKIGEPLRVVALFEGVAPDAATLRVTGDSMPMGVTRLALLPTGPRELSTEQRLPLCVSTTMRWNAALSLGGEREPAARFRFTTTPAGATER